MYWALFGIFHSLFRALFAEVNRKYEVDSWQLAFWHALVAFLLYIPAIPFMDWPVRPGFYMTAIIVALILSAGVIIQLNLSSLQKGRVSSISIPLEAFAAFFIWILITPYARHMHLESPVSTGLALGAMVAATGALYFIRRTDTTIKTFLLVAPVGITYAVAGVATKTVIPVANILPASLAFVFINFIVMTIFIGLAILVKRKTGPALYSARMIKCGVLTGALAALSYLTFVVSVVYAPNPGFTSILAVLVPVWLLWLHELRKEKDRANPAASLIIVACIIVLVATSWTF